MTAKDRYTKHRIAGLDHRAAANKAGIKNRNTRYAYGREYTETLAREAVARAGEAAKAKKDAQDAARAREAAAKAQEVARIKHEAWLASPEGKAEAEATKAADKRCPVCGYPVGKCPHSGPDFKTKLATHLAEQAAALAVQAILIPEDPRITNAVGDPHGRTDVNPVEAAEAWGQYRLENPLPERPDDGVWTESGGLITNRMRWEAAAKLKAVQDEEPNESDY